MENNHKLFNSNREIFDLLEKIHNLSNRENKIIVNDDVLIEATSSYNSNGEYQSSSYEVYEKYYLVFKASNDRFDMFYAFKENPGKWEQDLEDYYETLKNENNFTKKI